MSKKKGIVDELGLKGNEQLVNLDLDKVVVNKKGNPRKTFNEETIEELADSITSTKSLQPISVAPLNNGKYLIVDGHRRYYACKKHLKRSTIPAIIKPMTDEEIELISLVYNVQREDIPQAEKEDHVKKLYDRYGDFRTVAKKIGWKSPDTIRKHVQAWNDRHQLLSTRVDKDILKETSMTVLDATKKIEDPDKRAKFIEMIQDKPSLPWDLRRNKEALGKAVTIFNNSKPEIQDKILANEITFDDAKRLSEEIISKIEERKNRDLWGSEVADVVAIYQEQKEDEEALRKKDDSSLVSMLTGYKEESEEEITTSTESETQKIYTMEDTFNNYIKKRREIVIQHDIHFKSEYDDPETFARIQKKVMEVLSYVGSEFNTSEPKRMKKLEELAEYNALVHKITGLIQPLVDNEIKNSKTVDLQKLR